MIQHVIFDLDGTLVDSVVCCTEIINAMLDDRGSGASVSEDAARKYVSAGGAAMMAALLAEHCGDPDVEIQEFRRRYAVTRTPMRSLFPGVGKGLDRLRGAGLKLAICSNKPQNLCENVLRDVGFDDRFEVIVGGRLGIAPKPAPELLERTLEALAARPETCLFVGDSALDAQTAQRCGVAFVAVTYGYGEPGWAAAEPYRFDHFDLVTDAILGIHRAQAASINNASDMPRERAA